MIMVCLCNGCINILQARDDELANEVEVQDADDKDEDPESPFKGVQIELAPSETKPYTRYVDHLYTQLHTSTYTYPV